MQTLLSNHLTVSSSTSRRSTWRRPPKDFRLLFSAPRERLSIFRSCLQRLNCYPNSYIQHAAPALPPLLSRPSRLSQKPPRNIRFMRRWTSVKFGWCAFLFPVRNVYVYNVVFQKRFAWTRRRNHGICRQTWLSRYYVYRRTTNPWQAFRRRLGEVTTKNCSRMGILFILSIRSLS